MMAPYMLSGWFRPELIILIFFLVLFLRLKVL
jgi:hypothetical protein